MKVKLSYSSDTESWLTIASAVGEAKENKMQYIVDGASVKITYARPGSRISFKSQEQRFWKTTGHAVGSVTRWRCLGVVEDSKECT